MSSSGTPSSTPPGLPLVVQVGFAGSRNLFDAEKHPDVDAARFHAAVQQRLTQLLRELRSELRLSDMHFPCGLSALAIGADMLFTRSLAELNWPHRFLLPQQRDDFLAAAGSSGTPDFTAEQKQAARDFFAAPHVIHERVVSHADDRRARFQDVNLEIVRVSDVLVSLERADPAGKPGGTQKMVQEAASRSRPLLQIIVSVGPDGLPQFQESWRNREHFKAPALPEELSELQTDLAGIPSARDYCEALKVFASRTSKVKQSAFRLSALIIVSTHVLATICAVIAMKIHGGTALPWLLGGELVLLGVGFGTHFALHHFHATKVWAMARLVAEIARSAIGLRQVPGYLAHLFSLPLPASLRPLLRTLNVLHLRETPAMTAIPWAERQKNYVGTRLTRPKGGQIPYYEEMLPKALKWRAIARWAFYVGSLCAFLATLGKLLLTCHCLPVPENLHDTWAAILGAAAILLPVVAVAALSLAASFDVEGRVHTYKEMLEFLRSQAAHLDAASSERAFITLALETESHLLGETAAWYSRRTFTGV